MCEINNGIVNSLHEQHSWYKSEFLLNEENLPIAYLNYLKNNSTEIIIAVYHNNEILIFDYYDFVEYPPVTYDNKLNFYQNALKIDRHVENIIKKME